MKLGLFTVLFRDLTFEQMVSKVQSLGLDCVEIGTGGFPGNGHCNPEELLRDAGRLAAFRETIRAANLFISALACQGNPLHPDKAVADVHHREFEQTVLLAEKLEVPIINLLSGCPGDSPQAKSPNWAGFAWPPHYPELWEWQWNEIAVPYWKRAAQFAREHGMKKLAIEMHPGFLVYNPETALRLREAVGETIGVNLDPSHLVWLGIDVPAAIRTLGDAIVHCHAKDVALDLRNVQVNGVLDAKPYSDVAGRSWSFRTVGWGQDEATWRRIVSALRVAGFDGVLSIEHEDPIASREEGLQHAIQFLRGIVLREHPSGMWWA